MEEFCVLNSKAILYYKSLEHEQITTKQCYSNLKWMLVIFASALYSDKA